MRRTSLILIHRSEVIKIAKISRTPCVGANHIGHHIFVVDLITSIAYGNLPQIVDAGDLFGIGLRPTQTRQQQRHKEHQDRDDHQQFYKCEPMTCNH